jgi:hypothetical protein
MTASRALGHNVIEGRQILLAQTMRQYALMTGEQMPETLARGLLGLPTEANGSMKSFHSHRTNTYLNAEPC